jgi:hypothetical protein
LNSGLKIETIILTIITNNKKNNLETPTNEKKTERDEKTIAITRRGKNTSHVIQTGR